MRYFVQKICSGSERFIFTNWQKYNDAAAAGNKIKLMEKVSFLQSLSVFSERAI